MKYKQALEMVEQWLEKKHIRQFCRTACNGKCCLPQCDTQCQRPPLMCALYLCSDIKNILFGFHNGEKYTELTQQVSKFLHEKGFDSIKMRDTYPDLDIPDDLIASLLSTNFEEDVHRENF